MSLVASHKLDVFDGGADSDLGQARALPGRKLAERFEVGPLMGYGGSSLIFEGWHVVLRHPVAIKVLRADLAVHPELVNHFALEAMVTAQMRSPHVVRVFDSGMIDDKVPYTVLELLRGQTLSDLRRSGRKFTPEEAIDLVLQASLALDEAHRLGIVHRDIKPDNLFLAELPDGTHCLKVIDFGVAKHGGSRTYLSEAWVGTPGYMSPEQIANPGEVDARADVWALGVVLFELLTGRSPFRGTNREEWLTSTVQDEPLPLNVACQGLPLELYHAVQCCLSKDPAQRFSQVLDLAMALRRVRRELTSWEEATGIFRLPDNWESRVTPSHAWALPEQTVLLTAQKRSPRKRVGVGLAAVAAIALVAGIGHGPLFALAEEASLQPVTAEQAGPVIGVDAVEAAKFAGAEPTTVKDTTAIGSAHVLEEVVLPLNGSGAKSARPPSGVGAIANPSNASRALVGATGVTVPKHSDAVVDNAPSTSRLSSSKASSLTRAASAIAPRSSSSETGGSTAKLVPLKLDKLANTMPTTPNGAAAIGAPEELLTPWTERRQ